MPTDAWVARPVPECGRAEPEHLRRSRDHSVSGTGRGAPSEFSSKKRPRGNGAGSQRDPCARGSCARPKIGHTMKMADDPHPAVTPLTAPAKELLNAWKSAASVSFRDRLRS